MSMNIGSMLRAFLGNAAPVDGKTLELRIGQIVRGILMEMLDNGDALMNINGVSVRARLEAELPAGRGTLLQVQPGSQGGTIVLKPLGEASDVAPDEALKNVLKQFGMLDQKWSYELLRGLRRDGYALDSETASFFRSAAAARPAGADQASWAGAADVAFRRGLSATENTLSALRQTLFGQPLHEQLGSFASAFKQWMTDAAGSSAGKLPDWASGLQRLLDDGERILAQGRSQLQGEAAQSGAPGPASAAQGRPSLDAGPLPTTFAQASRTPGGQAAALNGTAAAPVGAQQPQPASPSLNANAALAAASPRLSEAGKEAALSGNLAASAKDTGNGGLAARMVAEEATVGQGRAQISPNAAAASEAAVRAGTAQEAAGTASQTAPHGGDSWIGRFLQWLGAGHEHRLLQAAADARYAPLPGMQPAVQQLTGEGEPSPHASLQGDTLKSALMSLAANDEAPPALREAAQSLTNHITGQQLLLSTERQFSQPYSFMTLFVPMKGQEGDTTASVHVQTRRNRKGEWDANNCRLLFDLRMRHLGSTVVDVQVVDRIVSLKLLNDHPGMADLVDQARGELGEGLRNAGFQLLSLKAEAFPAASDPDEGAGESMDRPPGSHASSAYASKPYRGVDFRI